MKALVLMVTSFAGGCALLSCNASASDVSSTSISAASCGATSSSGFAGGFVLYRTCDGHRISGMGTYINDATNNLAGFTALLDEGVSCVYASQINGTAGAFEPSFGCSVLAEATGRASNIVGLGTTVTDAANNVLGLAQILAGSGYRCSLADLAAVPGGFVPRLGCGQRQASGEIGIAHNIGGVGSTSTDAAENARAFAELYVTRAIQCQTSSSNIQLDGLVFSVSFTCTGRSVIGYGSTLTSAGADALLQAKAL
jgi:hypothetical protein